MPVEPKHREMERILREDILAGHFRVGERIPAERELSRQFGVAYMTVRQAIGNLVADELVQRIPGKGIFVRPLQETVIPQTSVKAALLVPALWRRLDPYYFPDILNSFEDAIGESGEKVAIQDYSVATQSDTLPPDSAVACLIIGKVETDLVEHLRDLGHRVLAINRYSGRRTISCVEPDNAGGTTLAVEHLVALGHKQIGFIRGASGNSDALERRRGFRNAMRKYDLSPDAESGDGFSQEAGYSAAIELLDSYPNLTALVSTSDVSAMGAIKAAQEKGRSIPANLSLVGFGDFSIAPYLTPPLTTIYQPRQELGRTAAQMLISLSHGDIPANALLPTHLVERGSTAPPAG